MIEKLKNLVLAHLDTRIDLPQKLLKEDLLFPDDIITGITTDGYTNVDQPVTLDTYKQPVPSAGTNTTNNNTTADLGTNNADNQDNENLLNKNADKIKYAINQVLDDIDKITKKSGSKMHTEFGMDKEGNIVFQESTTRAVYDELTRRIKNEFNDFKIKGGTDLMESFGNEETLNKLIQSAWMTTYNSFNSSQSNNTEDFVSKVLNNFNLMIDTLKDNPELIEVFTKNSSYADSSLTNNLPNYNNQIINYGGDVVQYADGTVHINNTTDDKKYQDSMDSLLEKLIEKYPNVDTEYLTKVFRNAQKNALKVLQGNEYDCPYGTGNNNSRVEDQTKDWSGKDNRKKDKSKICMNELVQITLYNFDKLLYQSVIQDGSASIKKTDDTKPTESVDSTPSIETGTRATEEFIASVDKTNYAINQVLDDIDKITKKSGSKMHTEFGMDKEGNIVFQESKTQAVFDEIVKRIEMELEDFKIKGNEDILSAIGGSEVLESLVQAAWLSTYNTFNSSQSNNTESFVTEVLNNLSKIINKIKSSPEMLEIYTQRVSYTDTSLTDDLPHYNKKDTYGGDEIISYKGNVVEYSNGSIHIDNTNDDKDYQETMEPLLQKLINKYPTIDKAKVTQIFRNAQKAALTALQSNLRDCPYGTGNNNSRVEDQTKDWSGKDNRKDDKFKIEMDQLVQMTLYYFDKLLYSATLS